MTSRVAHFLRNYVKTQLESRDRYARETAETQAMQSLVITDPDVTLQELIARHKIKELSQNEVRRLASLVETYTTTAILVHPAKPLTNEYRKLLEYSRIRADLTGKRPNIKTLYEKAVEVFGEKIDLNIADDILPSFGNFASGWNDLLANI